MTPERFNELLLDYLYDLLDEAEARAVREHVAAHPEAQVHLDRARGLLAGAARYEFPGVLFAAPTVEGITAPTPRTPVASPAAKPAPAKRGWIPWAVVAAVVVVLGVAAYPVTKHVQEYQRVRSDFQVAEAALGEARGDRDEFAAKRRQEIETAKRKVDESQTGMDELAKNHQIAFANEEKKAAEQGLVLQIIGPPAIQPGAPNDFRIAAINKNVGTPVSAKLDVRVTDQTGKVLYEEKEVHTLAFHVLHIPPDLPYKPDTQISLDVTATNEAGVRLPTLKETLPWAAPRYVTHLATDKPMYKPGHTVHFRSLTLNRASMRPPEEDLHIIFAITNPKGAEIFKSEGETRLMRQADGKKPQAILGPDGKPVRGLGVGEYVLSGDPEGGEYTLSVREANNRFPEEKRKFIVNNYQADRINKKLDFDKRTYGPGEEVTANITVSPAENTGPVTSIRFVNAVALVDNDRPKAELISQIDPLGRCQVRFKLPEKIETGKATLSVTFTDGAGPETVQKPIPLVIKRMFVDFYPEGGDLVAGVPNRVYFQAKNNRDKAADLQGRLLDSQGAEVAKVATFNDNIEAGANQGLGVFTFTPKAGEKYELKIDTPAGVEKRVPLQSKTVHLKSDGVAMMVPSGVTEEGQPIQVELHGTTRAREMLVGAYSRGRMLDQQIVHVQPGERAIVELKPAESIGGVVRVTAFEKRGASYEPKAERLVYRKSPRTVKYSIAPNKPKYGPGDTVSLDVTATDEKGNPARGVALVSVVDQSIITMADEKTARSLPTHFGFAGEIRKTEDLEHADFLLTDHPKAPVVLDLLLGVQGWRRFAEQTPQRFLEEATEREEAERLVVLNSGPGQRELNSLSSRREELDREYHRGMKDYADQLAVARDVQANVAKRQDDFKKDFDQKNEALSEKQAAAATALAAVKPYDDLHGELRRNAVPALAGIMLLSGAILVSIGLALGLRRGVRYHVVAAAALAAGVLLFVGISALDKPVNGGAVEVATVEPPAPVAPPNVVFDGGEGDDKPMTKLAEGAPGADVLRKMDGPAAPGGANGAGVPAPPGAPEDFAKPAEAAREKMDEKKEVETRPRAPRAPMPLPGKPVAPVQLQPERGDRLDPKFAKPQQADPNSGPKDGKKGDVKELAKGAANGKMDAAKDKMVPDLKQKQQPMGLDRGRFEEAQGRFRAQDEARRAVRGGMPGGDVANQRDMKARVGGMGGKPVPPAKGGFGGGVGGPGGPGMPGIGGGGGAGPAGPGGMAMPGAAGGAFARPGGFPGGGGGGAGGVELGAGAGFRPAMPVVEPPLQAFYFREFAPISEKVGEETRSQFAETVFWNPVVVLNDSGKNTVIFRLGDSVTSYRVLIAGNTLDGRLGEATKLIESRKTFSLETKLPVEMTASDRLDLPLKIVNDSDDERVASIDVFAKGLKAESPFSNEAVKLDPKERTRRMVSLRSELVDGEATVRVSGKAGPIARDGVERGIRIVPDGFPIVDARSDLLEKVARQEIVLPKDYVKGSLKLKAQIFPSTLADLQQGLAGLLREPGGCFEQTSSSNYPNTLILSYIKDTKTDDANAVARAEGMLARGYQKLISFECIKQGVPGREGYEWFGGAAPPHEALTAYGLLEFHDMAKVHAVDPAMVERTRQYLLSRRKADGGFLRNERALDTFGRAPQHITDAYIVWALSETGKDDLTKDINKLLKEQADSTDPYFLSLVANALINVGDGKRAADLLKKVKAKQAADGGLDGATMSITGSGGRDLRIEATALGILGWLKVNSPADFTEPLNKAIRWISQQRGGYGGFGSTQSTILALKALIAFTKASQKTAEAGDLTLKVGDQVIGKAHFAKGARDAVTLEVAEPEKFLKPGKNDVRLEVTSGSFPYTITAEYSTLTPVSSDKCSVRLSTKLDKQQANEGDAVRLTATLENVAGKGLPMTIAVIGLPAGVKVPEDMKQLKEMAELRTGANGEPESGEISFFEIRGRELVLYWRDVKPDAKLNLTIDLIAEIPGQFRGPASRAYLYYNADNKHWVEPLAITIAAAK